MQRIQRTDVGWQEIVWGRRTLKKHKRSYNSFCSSRTIMMKHLRNLSLRPQKSFSIAASFSAVNCPRSYVKRPPHYWKCLRPLVPAGNGAQLFPPLGEERHLRVKIR